MDLSKITIGGPCKITDVATVIYTEGNVTLTPKPSYRDIPSAVAGDKDDKLLTDLTWEIDFTPKSIWSSDYRAVLLPDAFVNFTASGARILGATNRAVTILGQDGEGWAFTRARLTQMPNLYLGLGKSLFGAAKITGFIGYNKALTDADAFAVPTTGNAWSQADYPTGHQEALCTATWAAKTGWSGLYSDEGFELTHELGFSAVKQGNITVDQRITGYRGMFAFKPQGPTTLQLNTAFPGTIGARRSTGAADFVVSGDGISVTLKSAAPHDGKYNFDNKLQRHDQFAMVTALTAPGTRLVFA
jgi:hypothetical protein